MISRWNAAHLACVNSSLCSNENAGRVRNRGEICHGSLADARRMMHECTNRRRYNWAWLPNSISMYSRSFPRPSHYSADPANTDHVFWIARLEKTKGTLEREREREEESSTCTVPTFRHPFSSCSCLSFSVSSATYGWPLAFSRQTTASLWSPRICICTCSPIIVRMPAFPCVSLVTLVYDSSPGEVVRWLSAKKGRVNDLFFLATRFSTVASLRVHLLADFLHACLLTSRS